MRDLYQDLGVAETASDDQIKAAYRELAKKHHPDRKGGDVERFKQVSAAYDVLGDADKRRQYDQMRTMGRSHGDRPQGFHGFHGSPQGFSEMGDMGDMFSAIFGHFGESPPRARSRSRDMEAGVEIPFSTAVTGGAVTLDREGQRLEVKIPPGVENGTRLRLRGQGARGGDLYVAIQIAGHPSWTREGRNVVSELKLPWIDMILGCERDVETVHGSVQLKIPRGLQPGDRLRIRGYGVKGAGVAGDHYAVLRPVFPDKLTGRQEELLGKLKSGG